MTRALLLSTYVKFVNLFPEIKGMIQNVFNQDSNIRSADAELQQRASEYLQLSNIVTTDVLVRTCPFTLNSASCETIFYVNALFQATVLEEMPAFPERESSILALLKRKKPGRVLPDSVEGKEEKIPSASPVNVNQVGLRRCRNEVE